MEPKKNAALYCRSSKDRSDISIAAQRRELIDYARGQGWPVVAEFTDVVESAKSAHRPGFQALIRELKSPARSWQILLVLDTSRLMRGMELAYVFRHECRKLGVELVFARLPQIDRITRVILESSLTAMDEVHSLMSREKGLAGMAENIRQGWRAGGRAPRGYRLRHVETGAIREGKPVVKSVLEPDDQAPAVARYLKARAAGIPRRLAAGEAGLRLSPSSLVAIEWRALTYAGHAVWNVHNERLPGGGYAGGTKRRPRSEWLIQHDTHPALIRTAEAEAIVSNLENSDAAAAIARARTRGSRYRLSGLLASPDGRKWEGNGRYYRLKPGTGRRGRWVPAEDIDAPVLARIAEDLGSPSFVRALTEEARRLAGQALEDPVAAERRELVQLDAQISRAMDLALALEDPQPAIHKVNTLEVRRKALAEQIRAREAEFAATRALAAVTEKKVKSLVDQRLADLQAADADPMQVKALLHTVVEQVTLDPASGACDIHYRLAADDSLIVASPRGFEPLLPP